jgi:hypothetical protein
MSRIPKPTDNYIEVVARILLSEFYRVTCPDNVYLEKTNSISGQHVYLVAQMVVNQIGDQL